MCGFGFHGKLNEFFHNKSTINYSLVCLYNINFQRVYSDLRNSLANCTYALSNLIGLAKLLLFSFYILHISCHIYLVFCFFAFVSFRFIWNEKPLRQVADSCIHWSWILFKFCLFVELDAHTWAIRIYWLPWNILKRIAIVIEKYWLIQICWPSSRQTILDDTLAVVWPA